MQRTNSTLHFWKETLKNEGLSQFSFATSGVAFIIPSASVRLYEEKSLRGNPKRGQDPSIRAVSLSSLERIQGVLSTFRIASYR
jgi:hypothetical protein